MIEPRSGPRLRSEPLGVLPLFFGLRLQHLDGDGSVQVQVVGLVDPSHRTRADQLLHPKFTANHLANERIGRGGIHRKSRAPA